jgi:hypothetical protein
MLEEQGKTMVDFRDDVRARLKEYLLNKFNMI